MTSPTELAAATGLSVPYACQLLNGTRSPSLSTALSVWRKTGLKFGPIANAADDDIEVMARVYGEAA